jgi:hypothetical protein
MLNLDTGDCIKGIEINADFVARENETQQFVIKIKPKSNEQKLLLVQFDLTQDEDFAKNVSQTLTFTKKNNRKIKSIRWCKCS